MGRRARLILMALLGAVFLGSLIAVLAARHRYREEDRLYDLAAEEFLKETVQDASGRTTGEGVAENKERIAPIEVDFDALLEACPDAVGWIYCEDTPINYPVVQGKDNGYYLRRSYTGTASTAGSIFIDASNQGDFTDSNTIIYGHHMKNGSMFACLDEWGEQEFYEAHPVMWLLTPGQDYEIVLFSGYTTAATSDTYRIFQGYGPELDEYLADCMAQSDFQADVDIDGKGRYVVLSTCAYVFADARHVLHGVLVPADSAGGIGIR